MIGQCAELETLGHSVLNGMSPPNPSPQDSGTPVQEEAGSFKSQRGWRAPREAGPSMVHILWQHAHGPHRAGPEALSAEKGE